MQFIVVSSRLDACNSSKAVNNINDIGRDTFIAALQSIITSHNYKYASNNINIAAQNCIDAGRNSKDAAMDSKHKKVVVLRGYSVCACQSLDVKVSQYRFYRHYVCLLGDKIATMQIVNRINGANNNTKRRRLTSCFLIE